LKACPFENLGLDSGFRRRDEFEASSLFVIPAPHQVRDKLQPESSGIEEEFDVYTITALLVISSIFKGFLNLFHPLNTNG